jgi:xanthine dehydrogenase molybdopterin-binding subunit B
VSTEVVEFVPYFCGRSPEKAYHFIYFESLKSHWTNLDSQLLFSRTPGIGYDWSKNEGKPFKYFTYGAACSEVEIDCLTGDHQVTS